MYYTGQTLFDYVTYLTAMWLAWQADFAVTDQTDDKIEEMFIL